MDRQFYVSYCGVGSPASKYWYLSVDFEIQRLYYILGGTGGYYGSDHEKHAFRTGSVYLFPYNLRHRFYSESNDPIRHLFFDFLSTPPIIVTQPMELTADVNSHLQEALALACGILSARTSKQIVESQIGEPLLRILLTLMDEISPIPFNMDPVICKSLEIIQNQYAEPLSVRQLSDQAGFEENYFIRRFSKVMKQTPYAYLRNYRLMQARNLLGTGLSMEKTAERVGYASAVSLARALRQGK